MPQRAIEPLCASVLVAACVFGGSGAPDRVLTAIPELVSLPLLVIAATAAADAPRRAPLWIAVAILALPALQLLPLPPQAWTRLPGRGPVADAYAAAGIDLPWCPVSLTPGETERIWLGLLPAVALFLAVPLLRSDARRRLLHVALALGTLDVLLGLGQLAGGEDSPLRVYAGASRSDAVGLFANRNHGATVLAVLIPLAGALFAARPTARERLWLSLASALCLLGIAASGSRAGALLGFGAAVASAFIVLSSREGSSRAGVAKRMLLWGGFAAVPLLAGLVVFGSTLLHLQSATLSGDARWRIAGTAWRVLVGVFPVGGGFGSFERLHAAAEPPDQRGDAIVNNAHDDWLEVVLEGGLPALLLLGAALAYLLRQTLLAREQGTPALRRATLAALWVCALHSIVDYPLRTMAVNVLLALACGLRAEPPSSLRRDPRAGR